MALGALVYTLMTAKLNSRDMNFVLFCLLIRNRLMKQICLGFVPFEYNMDSQFFGRFAITNPFFKEICVNNSIIISLKLAQQNRILRTRTDWVFFSKLRSQSRGKKGRQRWSVLHILLSVLSPRFYYRFFWLNNSSCPTMMV